MFKRNSGFTLIELIVVIAVLGILAAIIVPNISNFQGKARDTALTADLRNMQTAVDMFRVNSDSGVEEPIVAGAQVVATHQLADGAEKGTALAASETLNVIDLDALVPSDLRKAPKYVKNKELVTGAAYDLAGLSAVVDWNKGQVVAGIGTDTGGKSTAVVKYVSVVNDDQATSAPQITIVR